MKIITHKIDLKALYYSRHPFAKFYSHLQSCSSLHSFIFEQNSAESMAADNIK